MRRKGGQTLLDALLVADIRQDMAEDRQDAAVRGGDVQAALVHGREQADRLERNGLAAGVRAGDDERVEAAAELDVDRHGLGLVEQRMARAAEDQSLALGVGLAAVELVGELGLGKDQIQPDQYLVVGVDVVAVLGAVGGELCEDALDLKLFLGRELAQLVVGLDGRHRLDKERHARGGDVVHESRHGALVVCLDRDDIAVRAHGNDRLLQGPGIAGRGDDLLQRVARPRGRRAHIPPDRGEICRGAVRDLIFT